MATTHEELITRFSVDDRYTSAVRKISSETKKLNTTLGSGGRGGGSTGGMGGFFDGFAGSIRFAASELDSAIPGIQEVLGVLKGIAIAGAAAGAAILGFGIYAMHTAGELEALKLGLKAYSATQEDFIRNLERLREVARLPGLGFMEAIQGSTRLQAAGFDARLAERALLGFGNALAAVGGGKDELDGVILALSQIATKAQVSAEEINQISERVPQIRQLMLQAFGTANTEALAKMGISSQQFILGIIDAVEGLPKAMGGAKNAFENFGDIAFRITAQVGQALNDFFLPPLEKVASFLDYLENQDFFGKLTGGILKAIGGMDTFSSFVINVGAILAASFENLPNLIGSALDFVEAKLTDFKDFLNEFISNINELLDAVEGLLNSAPIRFLRGGDKVNLSQLPMIGSGSGDGEDHWQKFMGGVFGDIGKRADEILEGFSKFKPGDINDPNKGGFTFHAEDSLSNIERSTRQTADHTAGLQALADRVLGGGGRTAIDAVTIGAIRGGKNKAEREMARAVNAFYLMGQEAAINQFIVLRRGR